MGTPYFGVVLSGLSYSNRRPSPIVSSPAVHQTPLLELDNLTLRFGGVTALSRLDMEVREGELLALIGPNGAGKTSVLNCISGLYRPQEGSIVLTGRDGVPHALHRLPPHRIAALRVARTFQNIELFKHMTVLENLMLGRHVHMKGGVLSGGLYLGRQRRVEIEHRRVVEEVIDFMNLEPLRSAVVGNLAYGNQRLVEMARALALEPRILLLDEPTAGHERRGEGVDGALHPRCARGDGASPWLVIDHDIDVVMDIADRVVVLDFGRRIAQGTPEQVRNDPAVIDAYLGHRRESDGNPATVGQAGGREEATP